jgi:hypothetical protein
MASTYSSLKIELIGTGEQAGTWGNTTNTNLGTAIEEAIVESADVAFSSADVTLTLTDTNATQTARHLRLNLTGTSGGARNLILGSGCQIEKPYLINNGLADTVTVKNTSGTGIAVPSGKTMWVYNDGTNVVDAVTHLSSLSLSTALPITSGGTGSTSTTFVDLTTNVTGDLPFSNLTQGSALSVLGVTGNATADVASIAAGTDNQVLRRSGTDLAFGAVNLASSDAITGALPVANGGTGNAFFTVSGPASSAKTYTFPNENMTVAGLSQTQTFTNKRVTPRIGTVADAATITPTGDDSDQYNVTALAQAATIAAPSGTPTNGQRLVLRIKDNGTGRVLTWTTSSGAYRAIGTTLPITTIANKTVYVGCIYNEADTFWDVVAVAQQA